MADIMSSGGSAWHQWKKHGRCTGLSSRNYFRLTREALSQFVRPEILRKLPDRMDLPPKVIEAAVLEVNPDLTADGVTVTCRNGAFQEVRICLERDLSPRRCGADVVRDCRARTVSVAPVR